MKEDKIFDAYLEEKCPVCQAQIFPEHGAETTRGGKAQSIEIECHACLTSYRVGFERGANPVNSEILSFRGGAS